MTDTMTPEQRHRCMSRIKGKDTRPELTVRRWLWSHGLRYRLHVATLPGRPDIVIRRLRTVIFINGCFWHGHKCPHGHGVAIDDSECCRIPRSNRRFWAEKIRRNMQRDEENTAALEAAGWRVVTIWECDLRPDKRQQTLKTLLKRLNPASAPYGTFDDAGIMAAEPPENYGDD